MTAGIDTTFDFHSDTPDGKDPDVFSQKLLEYHKLLWKKELPSGEQFDLRPEPGAYLVHRSARGVFFLASEALTTRLLGKAAGVMLSIPVEKLPEYIGYTVGSTRVPRQQDRQKDDDQWCARIPPQDRRSPRSNLGVHPSALSW